MGVIYFYGSERPDIFGIERAAMDPEGLVVERLNQLLPKLGAILDVGAGDGFIAERLERPGRRIVAMEPSAGMRRPEKSIWWVGGEAEHLPFSNDSLDGAYATWAFFFSRYLDMRRGIDELRRAARPHAPLIIVENLGGDELSAYARGDSSADPAVWEREGFTCEELLTSFRFSSEQDARALLSLYRGSPVDDPPLTLSYRVGLFIGKA